ncbi:helix-turn-helix domain-containing protein [Streptomyces smyrnaeus]|uniref:Helix-turn-helix domain-containing protein n=1 Tax=Streptomyces smyrnaeus TaxID=1387713 RepID=A0ABS3XV09_9ACTN|nr:helix-turn-helix transcriptional regulator [Streptomyces smyrnaeus]MBO8199243.1 helix-turn-helix domain-containing protein [Streptomyces smyrnaeus]
MDVRGELSEFLKSRRARLRPEDVGLPRYQGQRRVPGLRREELALYAGVSVAHYTRLEQGKTDNVSPTVLDAIAGALRLDEDERLYLHRLAHPPQTPKRQSPVRLRPGLQRLLDSMTHHPVFVLGHHTDIVAWNRPAAALVDLASSPPEQRTWSHQVFCNQEFRQMLGDGWPGFSRAHVSYLRVLLARSPGDSALAAHVEAMRDTSADFQRLWGEQSVALWSSRDYAFTHPVVGRLELSGETVLLPGDADLSEMELLVAEPGSPSETALHHLVSVTDRKASAELH